MTLLRRTDGVARYDIVVRSQAGEEQVYRTLEVLSDAGTGYLLGRGTRVWKAVKIENEEPVGEPVALKDAWVDHLREREGSIDARIKSSTVNTFQSGILAMGLLNVLLHGDVFVAGVQDCTRSLPVRRTTTGDDPVTEDFETCSPYQVHYRIVYKEIGTPLRSITSFPTAFKALREVAYSAYCQPLFVTVCH